MQKSLMDRAIASVAPGIALKRERARIRLAMAERARAEYTGASQSRRTTSWRRTRLDANSELNPRVQAALREVARDMVRNNPWASRALHAWATNLIGPGITFQVYRGTKIDQKLTDLARRFFDTTQCDASGRHDLYGLQLQAVKSIVEGGAALARRRWRRASDNLPVPFQIQLLEPDYLYAEQNGNLSGKANAGTGYAINGIEFDQLGRRAAYWLHNAHPGSLRGGVERSASRVPARDIAHVFRADRIEQEHGATWFAPVIAKLQDFYDYDDAQLMRQKIAACFSVFKISDEDNIEASLDSDQTIEEVEPGLIYDLKAGQDIKFASPPGVDGFSDYSKLTLQAVSAGMNMPYFVITGDLTGFNFASGRMGWLEFQRAITALQWTMFIPQFCREIERWFFEAAAVAGEDVRGAWMEWTPPRREMISPETEIPAIRDAIRSGQMTISEAAKLRGVDPDVFLAEWAADAAKLDDLGLIFDSDPRKVTAVGNPTTLNTSGSNS